MSAPDLRARSPWSSLQGVQAVEITPRRKPIEAELRVPGSKSFTNRALILAAAADGISVLSGILKSDDSYWCCDTLKKLGIAVEVEGDTATIYGSNGQWPHSSGDLYIGAAGTIARFLPGVLAAADHGSWLVAGSNRMSERPISELVDGLRTLGAKIEYGEKEGSYPLRITACGLRGGSVSVSGKISSQFLSGLLIAAPLAKLPVTINVVDGVVQHAYVALTVSLMRQFGAVVEHNADLSQFQVSPTRYKAAHSALEADASTSCYFLALAAILGGEVTITNLAPSTSQPDIRMAEILAKMGAEVRKTQTTISVKGTGKLRGGFTQSMRELSDQALTLAAVAVFADAPIRITEVAHIRHHESDRIHAMFESLSALGISVEEHDDGLTVRPGAPGVAQLSSHDDHRIAMSLALIGTRAPGITILDPGCVSKTCPLFFDELQKLGIGVRYLSR